MCRMCEGASREQVLEEARCHIIHHGWFLQGILPVSEADGEPWVYTVGLLAGFGHPELVVTNIEYGRGGQLLNDLGEQIRQGLDLRQVTPEAAGLRHVRAVHPFYFEHDLVNTYIELEDRLPLAGDYLQVVPGTYCDHHQAVIADLSVPGNLGAL